MTIDEAINHSLEKSKECTECTECGKEHLQLAEWLKELKALRKEKEEIHQNKQKFQLSDIAYIIDEDFNFFESEVYEIKLIDGKYLYCTHDCDFNNEDIGEWVFESEMYREMHLEALSSQK